MRTFPSLAALMLIGAAASAQTFEVASIRPNLSCDGSSSSSNNDGRYIGRNVSLRDLVQHAYDLMEWQIIGPDWIRSEKFDVMAKPPGGKWSNEQFDAAMQSLLADRFKLQAHREKRVFPVYAMIIAKTGLKATKVENDGNSSSNNSRGHISAQHMTMAHFAERLSRVADRPVVDETGQAGAFDFDLKWTPDNPGPKPAESNTLVDEPPSLFTALEQQLGLKLEPRKAPIDVLVVDHAEKIPTEN